jgi:hypothetical protein
MFCLSFCGGKHRTITRRVTYLFKGVSFTSEGADMALVVKDTDVPGTVDVAISFVDSKGKPAKVDGVPTWTASDSTVVDSITAAPDGMSAKIHVTDTIGVSQVTVNADVDLGTGTNNVDFVDSVSVIAGDAVAANFTFGAVTPDVPPTP